MSIKVGSDEEMIGVYLCSKLIMNVSLSQQASKLQKKKWKLQIFFFDAIPIKYRQLYMFL